MTGSPYPRDLTGYGGKQPGVVWPEAAAIAVQFVVNYEEGGENCILPAAGLDTLTEAEERRLADLNDAYVARFGFPCIFAVKGRGNPHIFEVLEERLGRERETEFAEACKQVEDIALLRLEEMLP